MPLHADGKIGITAHAGLTACLLPHMAIRFEPEFPILSGADAQQGRGRLEDVPASPGARALDRNRGFHLYAAWPDDIAGFHEIGTVGLDRLAIQGLCACIGTEAQQRAGAQDSGGPAQIVERK